MTAADFDWEDEGPDDDDWWDDDPVHVKEEPDCYACNDTGFIYFEGDRRCSFCSPTRLEAWWSDLKWRWRHWRMRRRASQPVYDDEPPF